MNSLLPWVDAQGLWIEAPDLIGARKAEMEHLMLPLQDAEGGEHG